MKKFYVIIAVVAVGGIAVVGFALRGGSSAANEPVDLGDIGNEELVALAQGMVYGDPDAPATIMEFGNYQCPACQTLPSRSNRRSIWPTSRPDRPSSSITTFRRRTYPIPSWQLARPVAPGTRTGTSNTTTQFTAP